MRLELKYCSAWNYEPKALSLTAKILETYKQRIQDIKLMPGSGGCFELTADGQLLFSKLKEGKFPDEQWVLDTLNARLGK